jgi:hypothetical protein
MRIIFTLIFFVLSKNLFVSGNRNKIKIIFIKQSQILIKNGVLIHHCNKNHHNQGQIINDIPKIAPNNHKFKARSL